jgi:hypothetical protein
MVIGRFWARRNILIRGRTMSARAANLPSAAPQLDATLNFLNLSACARRQE